MSFIYLIHSDALWYTYALLQALLKTWDLDARGHLSVKGKFFCEGAIALCWAGLKLYRLTALKLRWPFLLCITCTWIQNQCKQRGKNPHHTQVQTQAESKTSAPNRRTSRIQCKSLPCCSQECRVEGDARAEEAETGSEHDSRLGDADGSQLRGGSEHLTQT